MMKLIETVIDEESVELTYSDAPEGIHGDHYLQLRMPLTKREDPSLARIRIDALEAVLEWLRAEVAQQHNILRR